MAAPTTGRLDSRLEAEGAEFLVLAHLLIEGIQATKAYTRFPGYDVIAMDPDAGTSCRIQVKSRWATDYDRGFPLGNLDTDFVVLAALNRGYRRNGQAGGKQPPQLYVFPIEVLKPAIHEASGWTQKVWLRDVPGGYEQYADRWDLVRAWLADAGRATGLTDAAVAR